MGLRLYYISFCLDFIKGWVFSHTVGQLVEGAALALQVVGQTFPEGGD
jgi:hypothetical protein